MKTTLLRVAAATALVGLSSVAFAQATINQSKITAWPYNITQPGHYKLTGNISVPAGVTAFQILAPGVTFDLNGFTIAAPGHCSAASKACTHSPPQHVNFSIGIYIAENAVTVRNGTVRGFEGSGVLAIDQHGTTIENVTAMDNATVGFRIYGHPGMSSARVSASTAIQNGQGGFIVHHGLVERSVANANGGTGFTALTAAVMDSVAHFNVGYGMFGGKARGVALQSNTLGNRSSVLSMGGNIDGGVQF
jgi:Right handed beta helix region